MILSAASFKAHMAQRRVKAEADALARHRRTKILQILYGNMPKQADMLARSEGINAATDQLLEELWPITTH